MKTFSQYMLTEGADPSKDELNWALKNVNDLDKKLVKDLKSAAKGKKASSEVYDLISYIRSRKKSGNLPSKGKIGY